MCSDYSDIVRTGSLSYLTANKIYIFKTGEKFPPLKYDASLNPDTVVAFIDGRRGELPMIRKTVKPTTVRQMLCLPIARFLFPSRLSLTLAFVSQVSVDLQLGAIFEVDERSQQFRADFVLTSRWTDQRLRNPEAPAVTDYDLSILDKGQIWNPDITFMNQRGAATEPGEGAVHVYSSGRVVAVQHFISTFAAEMDLRDFPYDAHTLAFVLRSGSYAKDEVRFRTAARDAQENASALLRQIADPVFTFDDYVQSAGSPEGGPFRDYSVLTISVRAERLSTMATVTLVVPLCLICAVGCLALVHDAAADARIALPATGAAATMALSYVLATVCPAVGYGTRVHALVLHTYCFLAVQLLANAYLRAICLGRRRLEELNAANRRLVKDAEWVARRMGGSVRDATAGGGGSEGGGRAGWDVGRAASPKAAPELSDEWPDEPKAIGLNAMADMPEAGDFHLVDVPAREGKPAGAPTFTFRTYERMLDPPVVSNAPAAAAAAESAAAAARRAAAAAREAAAPPTPAPLAVASAAAVDWGGGPVRVLLGLVEISNGSTAAWGEHVRWVDDALRAALPAACVLSVALILTVGGPPELGSTRPHMPGGQAPSPALATGL